MINLLQKQFSTQKGPIQNMYFMTPKLNKFSREKDCPIFKPSIMQEEIYINPNLTGDRPILTSQPQAHSNLNTYLIWS